MYSSQPWPGPIDQIAVGDVARGRRGARAHRPVARGRQPQGEVGHEDDGGDGERAARAGRGREPDERQQKGPALGVARPEGEADERVGRDPAAVAARDSGRRTQPASASAAAAPTANEPSTRAHDAS